MILQSKTARTAMLRITSTHKQNELAESVGTIYRNTERQINELVLHTMLDQGFAPVVVAFVEEVLNGHADNQVYEYARLIASGKYPNSDTELALQMHDAVTIAARYLKKLKTTPSVIRTAFAA